MKIATITKENNMPEKIENLKKAIENGTYDWAAAIEHTAERIIEYPESLLWC